MKALKTIYLSPTNTKGARIKITDGDGNQMTESRDYAIDYKEQAEQLAQRFLQKMDWNCEVSGIGGFKGDYFITLK